MIVEDVFFTFAAQTGGVHGTGLMKFVHFHIKDQGGIAALGQRHGRQWGPKECLLPIYLGHFLPMPQRRGIVSFVRIMRSETVIRF